MSVNFFLKLDGIKGESVAEGFQGQIQLQSFSFGGTNASSVNFNQGSGSGKVSLGPLTVTKQPDSASHALFLSLCNGTHVEHGVLSLVKAGSNTKPYLTLDLSMVFVTAFHTASTNEIPVETISLTYRAIMYTYFAQGTDGILRANGSSGWDVAKGKKL